MYVEVDWVTKDRIPMNDSFDIAQFKIWTSSILVLALLHKHQIFHCDCISHRPRVKEKLEQLPCERFLQDFEFSRAFLPSVLHGKKREKF